MHKIKGILFDIDDTLYSHKLEKVPELTIYAIQELKRNGFKIGLCTSRFPKMFYSLPNEIFDLADLVISGTGCVVHQNHQVIHTELMDHETSNRYIDYLNKQDNIYYLWLPENGDSHFSKEPFPHVHKHHIKSSGSCPSVQEYKDETLMNITYYNASDEQIKEILKLSDTTNIEQWGDCGHIHPPGINKAYGIELFAKHFNLALDEVACFGDGHNDVSMIKKAGMGIAVGNGHDLLKQHADFVCDDIIQGGIYTFCVDQGWIKPIESNMFFFDIDGTSYHNQTHTVLESTWNALKKLRQQNHKLFICTSRSYEEMVKLPSDFIHFFDGVITLSGGHMILDGHHHYQTIDQEDIERGIKYCDEHQIPYRYVTNTGHGYLCHPTEFVTGLFDRLYNMIPPVKPYEHEPVVHLLYYTSNQEHRDYLDTVFSNSLIIQMRYSFEVTKKDLDKGKSIEYIADLYQSSIEHAVAFGDSSNDISMLRKARIGIAMGNASDSVKENADYVTDIIDDDGLYKACKHFKWIE